MPGLWKKAKLLNGWRSMTFPDDTSFDEEPTDEEVAEAKADAEKEDEEDE